MATKGAASGAMLEAALNYSAKGVAVFPVWWTGTTRCACPAGADCSSWGKHPLTKHGFVDATTDESQICAWWKKWPRAYIALPTGTENGYDVLDVDPRNGGEDSFQVVKELGTIPMELVTETGGGGWHVYFRATRQGLQSKPVDDGLDWKTLGGYVVLPPSGHRSGNPYAWGNGITAGDDAPDAPGWLVDYIRERQDARRFYDAPENSDTPRRTDDQVIREGERHDWILQRAGKLLNTGLRDEALLAALAELNRTRCQPPLPDDEIQRIALDACTKWTAHETSSFNVGGKSKASKESKHERSIVLTPASEIHVRPVHWLWDERLPLGTFSLLGGREGVGKTILVYTIAAKLTRGTLPGKHHGIPKSVFIAATEDSWEHTIIPRLMAAAADLDHVFRVEVKTSQDVEVPLSLPRDLKELEALTIEKDAALLILDPLLSRLDAALDAYKDPEVRRALEPLVALANRTSVHVTGLIHVNKSSTSDALSALMGSRAFVAVARAVLFVMKDPDDEERRLLGQPKNNLGRADLETLVFRIVGERVAETPDGEVWTGKLEWLGKSDQSLREAMDAASQSTEDRSATQEAAEWLDDFMVSQGGRCPSKVVITEGKKAGHSKDAIQRARGRLKIAWKSQGYPRETVWLLQSSQTLGEPATTATTVTTVPGETH